MSSAFQSIHFQALKERLQEQLPADSYAAWFAPLALGSPEAGGIKLLAESEFACRELRSRYAGKVQELLGLLGFPDETVEFLPATLVNPAATTDTTLFQAEITAPRPPARAPAVIASMPAIPSPIRTTPSGGDGAAQAMRLGLIPHLSFDRFEEGPNNNLALAASRKTAEVRGAYNPLFIHGGSGLGKTHLLHAIGNYHLKQNPGAHLVLTTGHGFVNDFVATLRQNDQEKFKRRYWLADVLLIDDIHILAGKGGSMQAFFETFNTIHENGGQIVLTSDQPPKKIDGLEERLRTRFEWGLLADIQPYPLEVRVKILKRKGAEQALALPDEAAWFMASRLQKNVRELEGALEKVKLFAEIRAEPVTLELAKEALAGDLPQSQRQLSLEKIVEQVASYFHFAPRDLTGPSKLKKITEARHAAVYLINRLTGLSNAEIARRLGDRNPSTIHHALKKVELRLHQDPDYATLLENLEQQLL